jgi:predicted acyltransferase
VVFGVNPLVAFAGSGVMARLLDMSGLKARSYRAFFKPYFEPRLASLLWALAFVLIWYGLLYILYKRRVFVRL